MRKGSIWLTLEPRLSAKKWAENAHLRPFRAKSPNPGPQPKRFRPGVGFWHRKTRITIQPMIGISRSQNHQPDRSVSCIRRTKTERPGNRKTRLTMPSSPELLPMPDIPAPSIVATMLQSQLAERITMDFATARRLFTLICVLHIK